MQSKGSTDVIFNKSWELFKLRTLICHSVLSLSQTEIRQCGLLFTAAALFHLNLFSFRQSVCLFVVKQSLSGSCEYKHSFWVGRLGFSSPLGPPVASVPFDVLRTAFFPRYLLRIGPNPPALHADERDKL